MRKIKDNGRTLKLVIDNTGFDSGCSNCAFYQKIDCPENTDEKLLCCDIEDEKNHIYIETLPSRLSRFIKRMVIKRKWARKIYLVFYTKLSYYNRIAEVYQWQRPRNAEGPRKFHVKQKRSRKKLPTKC